MTDVAIGLSGLGALFVLIALRVPIAAALIGVSFVGIWFLMGWRVAWGSLGVIPYQFTANWVLSSIPMFLFLGFISFHTNLTRGLFQAARVWLSALPGGLAIAAIFGSAGFAAVSGSSIACSAAMGRIAIPEMMKHKYHPELATGTVAVAGTIGAMIPPSIILILYGVIAQVSIAQLFLGGISAGILTAIGYIVVVLVRVKLNPDLAPSRDASVGMAERLAALKETWPILLVMVGIFGGLFSGIFTPTEAGAVGAFLACVVATLSREMTLERFLTAARETMTTTAALIAIAAGASLLTRFLALSGAGDFLSDAIIAVGTQPVLLMLGIVLVYLVLGMFLEPIGAMLLTLPIILPVVDEANWSLLWFGVVLTKLLEIGMITPPIGMNVFVIKGVVGDLVKTGAIFRGVMWFIVMDLLIVALLSAVPQLILYLPMTFG
ncbi:TRAP transporter, DctM subunit [Thalassovita litoralis]|jgi:tripartite ATP-independent transporter DctM subunit|uniref:TRAP transporter large permease protein n=1 Tax=Thalassovita litoralis TaxID=1010611 RepID=A0A521C282_9RHOB|nr:TRAP transporter large permease [Thalassovita litoralis]SMO53596.1 TRAP transporter, DctM subunit [Thalassovita litoralis]